MLTLTFLLSSIVIYYNLERENIEPNIVDMIKNYNNYKNSSILVSGEILKINISEKIMIIRPGNSPNSEIEIDFDKINIKAEKGDIAEIYGIYDGKYHITAKKINISPRWKYDLIYIRSIPAIPFVIYLFFRKWRFNFKKLIFERREKNNA